MTWSYNSERGLCFQDGILRGTGYSGHGEGLNNPAMEAVHGVGPIPRGDYKIVRWDDMHGKLGPLVAILEPVAPFNAYGRTLLRIHGDNELQNQSASDGCVILGHWVRDQMMKSGDADFRVV
ncbi:MAG TPA: tlde1 domain-containing protein [Candidatus Acidoferrales bacterium]|nr:tlde1 domain-containing protein [Candidatus Acidoferrales bacterium]